MAILRQQSIRNCQALRQSNVDRSSTGAIGLSAWRNVLFDAFLFAMCFYVARTWTRWVRRDVKVAAPKWRSAITTLGFAASTVSLVVIVMLVLQSLINGGLAPFHPTILLALRVVLRDFTVSHNRRDPRHRPAGNTELRLLSGMSSDSPSSWGRIVTNKWRKQGRLHQLLEWPFMR